MKGGGKRGMCYQIKGLPYLKLFNRETTFEDVQELLHEDFPGKADYKFAAIFKSRITAPEYFCVYELDNLLDEVCRYAGIKMGIAKRKGGGEKRIEK